MKQTENKGITLIALVITIIVMLILVGVTINLSLNGGLFGYAKQAVKETENARDQELDLANGEVIDYYLNVDSDVQALPKYADAKKENGILTENAQYVEGISVAVIPKGFKVSDKKDEQTIANGLVIQDEEGNEFVWIPVTDGTLERTAWFDNEPTTKTTEEITEKWTKEDYKAYIAKQNGYNTFDEYWEVFAQENSYDNLEEYIGECWDWTDGFDGYKDWASVNVQNIEKYIENADNDPTGEYANMVASVAKYKGFYIGRYEAGSTTARTSSSGTTIMVVQKGAYPYNYVCWGKTMTETDSEIRDTGHGAVWLSKNMYTDNDTYGVTSVLTYGAMWDETLKFIRDKVNVTNSTSWGNYKNNTFTFSGRYYSKTNGSWKWSDEEVTNKTKAKYTNWLLTTGASETNKAKNIYDLAGNLWEWTMEAYESPDRVGRGGYYDNFGGSCAAATCNRSYPDSSYKFKGFRPALYVTLDA